MVTTPVALDVNAVLSAMESWIKQKPEIDPANYNLHAEQIRYSSLKQVDAARRAYRSDLREIGKQRKRALASLAAAHGCTPHKPEIMADAFRAFSGRLQWDGSQLRYTTGQYFPTEYRAAAAAVLDAYVSGWRRAYSEEHPQTYAYRTVEDVKKANKSAGFHFFDRDSMQFFRSAIASQLYGGRYFVTSEQFSDDTARLYTVREAKPSGAVDSIGEFQGCRSLREAVAIIKRLLS